MLALIVAFLVLSAEASSASDFSIHGFVQGNCALDTADENPDGGEFKWAEERFQLKAEGSRDSFRAFIKADAFHDHVDDKTDAELREGYVDATSGSWDARIGRQIVTWGIGDLIFINDLFPKDYEAFYSGRPMEYLKKGVDGIKGGIYPSALNIEAVVMPLFEPDSLPEASRFHNAQDMDADEPDVTLENTQVALRAYRNIGDYDISLYFNRGFDRMPAMNESGDFFYPKLSVYGASIEARAFDGVWGLEAGYYDSREDRAGDEPSIPNSSSRALLSFKRQIIEDLNLGVQYYLERMQDWSTYSKSLPAGYSKQDKLYQLMSIRLTQMLMHQNLTLSMFAFYSPSDGDYLLNPEAKYKFSDNIWAAVGGNVFGGRQSQGRFGAYDKNDNAYAQMRYEF